MVAEFIRDAIARRIAGDIVWSDNPGSAMKKWRDIFKVSQVEIGKYMGISPSVISDYEKGRRVPGSKFVKRFVEGLLRIDEERGWTVVRQLAKTMNLYLDAITDICEFSRPLDVIEFSKIIRGEVLTSSTFNRKIYGYTVLDSIKAIESLTGAEFFHIMGLTSERALVFTRVSKGRSPMVAVRVSLVKPATVVLHGPKVVDELAIKLAEQERLPLILSKFETVEELLNTLKSLCRRYSI